MKNLPFQQEYLIYDFCYMLLHNKCKDFLIKIFFKCLELQTKSNEYEFHEYMVLLNQQIFNFWPVLRDESILKSVKPALGLPVAGSIHYRTPKVNFKYRLCKLY